MIEMTTVDKEGRAKIEPVILVPKDYVQIVRCKDCKFSTDLQTAKLNKFKCQLTKYYYQANDFCSYGERKKNEIN